MPLCMWSLRRACPPAGLVDGVPPDCGCCANRTDAPVRPEIIVAHLLKHLRVLMFIDSPFRALAKNRTQPVLAEPASRQAVAPKVAHRIRFTICEIPSGL